MLENINRALQLSGLQGASLMYSPLASAEAVLSREDSENGAVVVDIGDQLTHLGVFLRGALFHSAVIDPEGFVKNGNEWVLKARLYDARFFFEEDQRTPLIDRLGSLDHLTFHRELGSYAEKTGRIAAIAAKLATRLGFDADQATTAARACKCDLRTLMVGEFPELQGVMGGEYLRREGAPEAVWQAVKEHYQPIAAEAPIPATDLGCVLAVADKLDTLAGCFAIGQIPSGSKDPLALRRAGAGIVRILWEKGWGLSPIELCRMALQALGGRATRPEADTLEALE